MEALNIHTFFKMAAIADIKNMHQNGLLDAADG